jgi:hypothetical protein
LVKACLEQLASQETETERLKRQEGEIRSRITDFSASSRLSREEAHSRSNGCPTFSTRNILLYSISHNPAESLKRDRALAVLDNDASTMFRPPGRAAPTQSATNSRLV